MKRMRTSKRFRLYKKTWAAMCKSYPAVFPRHGRRPPLKIGILKDIVSDGSSGMTACQTRLFLSIWTRSSAYLQSVSKTGARVGLDGTECGTVNPDHAAEAKDVLTARRRKAEGKGRLTTPL